MAKQATKDALSTHEAAQKKTEEAKAAEEKALATLIESLKGERIEVKVRATEKGGLFKSITAEEIANILLTQRRVRVPATAIKLDHPIKTIGEHGIKISAANGAAEIVLVLSSE